MTQTKNTFTAEAVELFGQTALFMNERIPRSALPDGVHRYELREDGNGNFAAVENKVMVNFGGTIVTKTPLDLGNDGYFALNEETDLNFLGYELTTEEFLAREDIK